MGDMEKNPYREPPLSADSSGFSSSEAAEIVPDPETVDHYNRSLDLEAWDYEAAGNGTDEITQAIRELLRQKYDRLTRERLGTNANKDETMPPA